MQQYAGQWRIKEMAEILDVSRNYISYSKFKSTNYKGIRFIFTFIMWSKIIN